MLCQRDCMHAGEGNRAAASPALSLSLFFPARTRSEKALSIHMSYLHWLRLYTLHLVAKKQYEPKLIDRVLTLHRPDSQFKPCRPLSSKKNDKKDVIHEEHTHHLCMHGHQFCICTGNMSCCCPLKPLAFCCRRATSILHGVSSCLYRGS